MVEARMRIRKAKTERRATGPARRREELHVRLE